MTSKKDDADLRAEALVRVYEVPRLALWTVKVGDDRIYTFEQKAEAEETARYLVPAIAHAIRAAVAEAEGRRDKILTDLLCNDTERGEEMWRLGAEAMRQKAAYVLSNRFHLDLERTYQGIGPLPLPPSVSATGEVLQPSRLRLKAERMEKALRDLVDICGKVSHGYRTEYGQALAVAREALEEPSEDLPQPPANPLS